MSVLVSQLHAAFHQPETRIYRFVQGTVWSLILASILLLVGEALLPGGTVVVEILAVGDRVLLSIFAVELLLRVATFRPPVVTVFRRSSFRQLRTNLFGKIGYLVRPIMLVDLLAVVALVPELRGLRALRLLRLLRSTRLFRYRNPFAIVMQAFEESRLLFVLAFGVLGLVTLLGGISIYLVEVRVNDSITTLLDGLWWALVTVTTVGFGDIAPSTLVGRLVGAAVMVAGMFTLALFAGIVGSSLVSGMLSIREEQFRMSDYANHVIVCGYDGSTHLMLDVLAAELNLEEKRVVLFDDRERPREVPPEFLWVRGDPTKESELDKVRLTRAAAVIVTGRRGASPQVADARTILVAFTVRAYLERHRQEIEARRFPVYMVVEILDSENVGHARMAGADEVLETQRVGYSMIAHSVGYHGTAAAMSRVLLTGSHNIYAGQIPRGIDSKSTFGELLAQLGLSKKGGLIIGLRTSTGTEVINPPKDYELNWDEHLLYLAQEPLLPAPD
ncbi:MAG: ion transporter [Acidobacteriota bacterium]|nr:ion transporter [Acidobacteriota bacterium]